MTIKNERQRLVKKNATLIISSPFVWKLIIIGSYQYFTEGNYNFMNYLYDSVDISILFLIFFKNLHNYKKVKTKNK
jgi:hypothetical protein